MYNCSLRETRHFSRPLQLFQKKKKKTENVPIETTTIALSRYLPISLPPHNPIYRLNRRIIPLRFALLPYLHKGGSQRPRSLSPSLSCAFVHASIENGHEAPPFSAFSRVVSLSVPLSTARTTTGV